MSEKYGLAEHVVCRQTNNELRMLFDRRKGVMYELNESASAIVDQLTGGMVTAESLCGALAADFNETAETISDDVHRLLEDFRCAGLIIVEP